MSPKVAMVTEFPGLPPDTSVFEKARVEFMKTHCTSEDEIVAAAKDADAVIGSLSRQPFSRRVMENLPKCRFIMGIGIGYERMDVKAATDLGILVANNAEFCTDELSDHAMALLLACARKLFKLDRAVREGKWGASGIWGTWIQDNIWPSTFKLRGQTLGIIGLGKSGCSLAPKAQGFGLKVIAYSPRVSPSLAKKLKVKPVDLDQLLKESDYISIHSALTSERHHLLGPEEFKKMKPTAYLVNTARGAIIDEKALITALSQGIIAGAGLDVMEIEPPSSDNPLLKMDNVIISAHSAHYSDTSRQELLRRPVEKVIRVLKGEWPRGILNPEVKERFTQKWGCKSAALIQRETSESNKTQGRLLKTKSSFLKGQGFDTRGDYGGRKG